VEIGLVEKLSVLTVQETVTVNVLVIPAISGKSLSLTSIEIL